MSMPGILHNLERCGIDDRRWYAGLPLQFYNDNIKLELLCPKFIGSPDFAVKSGY